MKKARALFLVAVLGLTLLPATAFSWERAAHSFIVDRLGKQSGRENVYEMYGSGAPDILNFSFSNPYMRFVYYQTHYEFMRVWDQAKTKSQKDFAYGFVSHNDFWGADRTAHHAGITFGQSEGYIIAKAQILKGILEQVPDFNALQLPDSVALDVCHQFTENGVDILLKRLDSSIGQKVMGSAMVRQGAFPNLMVSAYADELAAYAQITRPQARKMLMFGEQDYRQDTILYGYALTLDEESAVLLISQQMAGFAQEYLAAAGIILPEGADLTPLIVFATQQAMNICADDFEGELAATVDMVGQELMSRGILY